MIITTGNFTKALWPGVNKWYTGAYGEYKTEWDKIFSSNKSRRAWEEDVGMSGFGLAMQKAEGAPVQYDTERQGFITRYTHVEYALGFQITRNMVSDDLYDIVGPKKSKSLAFSIRQTKEVVGANVINRFATSGYTGGDGKTLGASDHPNIAGGTWSNLIGTAADISESALEQACLDIYGLKNDRGLTVQIRPKAVLIPKDLDFETNKIMKTEYEVGTNNNTVNLVRSRFPGGVIMNHFLTDTDAWFVLTDVQDGLKMFEREADRFAMDNDFDTDNAKYKAVSRYAFGWTDPRAIYCSAGA